MGYYKKCGCCDNHNQGDSQNLRNIEVRLEDILVQLQRQWQYQNQWQYQDQWQAQAQSQSDKTKFENNGNPTIHISNEANASALAAIVVALAILGNANASVNQDTIGQLINLLKEGNNG